MNHYSTLFSRFNFLERALFIFFALSFIVAFLSIISLFVTQFTIETPTYGGTYHEGMTGSPVVVNPILATTATDQSLSKLIYSGLLRKVSWNSYQSDLANCIYDINLPKITCSLRPEVSFHDGTSVTADDIVFTIDTILALGDKSPWKDSLTGVSIKKIDESTVEFTLPKKFSGFSEALTIGILPKHIWRDVPASEIESRTSDPTYLIGSGPYVFKSQTNQNDFTNSYTLSAFPDFILGKPFISVIKLSFYHSDSELIQAFESHSLDAYVLDSSLVPTQYSLSRSVRAIPIIHPDLYGVFVKSTSLNEINSLKTLAKNLETADFSSFGIPWDKTLPPWNASELVEKVKGYDILSKIVSLSNEPNPSNTPGQSVLVTVNQGILADVTRIIQGALTKSGIPTELQIYDFSGFKNSIIPKRAFGYLIFGTRYRHISDVYAYWNSAERTDPGLNITELINQPITSLTESLLDQGLTYDKQNTLYQNTENLIAKQNVFLPLFLDRDIYMVYTQNSPNMPTFIYNPTIDRFNQIYLWYVKTNVTLSFK